MKRYTLFFLMLLLLTVGFSSQLYAQKDPVIIVPPSNPDSDGDGLPDSDDQCPKKAGPRTNRGCPERESSDNSSDDSSPSDDPSDDSDGDGLSDSDDQCPKEGGPTWNGGCPESDQPTVPDPNDIPDPDRDDPFIFPAFPSDGCYVTPNGDFKVNVRKAPELVAAQMGHLLPGVVYKSEGFITKDANIWFVLNGYEGNIGDTGYAAGSVVLASGCGQSVLGGSDGAPDGFTDRPDTPLCHLSVGYDSPTWSDDPQVPSYTYASFWFEAVPGEPIPAGTQVWGVIYVADFITLPDAENSFAVAPDPALFEEASNSDYAGAYNWPTMNGGIQSGDTILYRLSPPYNSGACGSIVGIDDLVIVPDAPDGVENIHIPINEFACTIIAPFNWTFAFNFAPGEAIPEGTHPVAILNGDLDIAGDVNLWKTSMKLLGNTQYEYINYDGWAELPRVGGDCGWARHGVGIPALAAGSNNLKNIGLAIHNYRRGGQDGSDLLIVNNGDGSDFNEDGDLDLFLVNAPGGDNDPEWPWQVGFVMVFGGGNSDDIPSTGQNDTVEYCVYLEVHEAGVFEEVCYEIEVPEGCVLVAQEAGVYKLVCDETGTLNPGLGGLPAIDFQAPQRNDVPISVGLRLIFGQGAPDDVPPSNGQANTVEYCLWQEVQEAGVFEEVCYEIEIPEGCILTTVEAGVFTMDCEEDEPVQVNPVFDDLPMTDIQSPDANNRQQSSDPIETLDTILSDLCHGDYIIWWDEDENSEPIPSTVDGGCWEWL